MTTTHTFPYSTITEYKATKHKLRQFFIIELAENVFLHENGSETTLLQRARRYSRLCDARVGLTKLKQRTASHADAKVWETWL